MIAETRRIDLATRLRRISEILDELLPDAEASGAAMHRVTAIALECLDRNVIPQAVFALVDAVRKNPFWMRGYLFLAIIYRAASATQEAVATRQTGTKMCRTVRRFLIAQISRQTIGGAGTRAILSRLLDRMAIRMAMMKRYDDILRHQLALTLVGAGQFEEALLWLTEGDVEHAPMRWQ
ncbi:MAG: hypothetical protein EPO64_10940 [Nitrospirae bacterium]|nr:MAG: hypothetical protein EPO64_10940 [Nitrospirota bacterium]